MPNRPSSSSVWFFSGAVALVGVGGVGWWATDPTPPAIPPSNPNPFSRSVPQFDVVDDRAQQTGGRLHDLRLGMSRAEVETLLGSPSPSDIDPVDRSTGRAVFRTRYAAYLTGPVWFATDARGMCDVVLEFDASRPGHPLTKLTCTAKAPNSDVVGTVQSTAM